MRFAMGWGCCVVVSMFGACAEAEPPLEEAPPPTLAPLCLSVDRGSVDFDVAEPGDARRVTVSVTSCDGAAFDAQVDTVEGFVVFARARATDGQTTIGDHVAAGESLAIDVHYLARTIDDGAAGDLVVHAHRPGQRGEARVALSGIIALTCEECDCCDHTTKGWREAYFEPQAPWPSDGSDGPYVPPATYRGCVYGARGCLPPGDLPPQPGPDPTPW